LMAWNTVWSPFDGILLSLIIDERLVALNKLIPSKGW